MTKDLDEEYTWQLITLFHQNLIKKFEKLDKPWGRLLSTEEYSSKSNGDAKLYGDIFLWVYKRRFFYLVMKISPNKISPDGAKLVLVHFRLHF